MEEEISEEIGDIIADLAKSNYIGEEELAVILELSDRINLDKKE